MTDSTIGKVLMYEGIKTCPHCHSVALHQDNTGNDKNILWCAVCKGKCTK